LRPQPDRESDNFPEETMIYAMQFLHDRESAAGLLQRNMEPYLVVRDVDFPALGREER
jgi:hypothetical protein